MLKEGGTRGSCLITKQIHGVWSSGETGARGREVLAEATGLPREDGKRRECGLGLNTHQRGRQRNKLAKEAETEVSEEGN